MKNYNQYAKWLIYLLCGLFTMACYDYHYLPDDLKFSSQIGDTIIYESNNNQFDTFRVKNIILAFEIREKSYKYEMQRVTFAFLGSDSAKGDFFRTTEIILTETNTIIDWGDWPGTSESQKHESYELNNNLFLNVFENIADTIYHPTSLIYKLYFNRNEGVLKYCYKNGEEYEFYKAIKH